MAKTSKPIPVTLVTGLLGSGKTSVIHQLFQHKPAEQRWGLLVNEFGDIGIDAATLAVDSEHIEAVSGGCICCSAQFGYQQALQKLLKHPLDRILVEPTGLGHPAKTLDTLKQFAPTIQIAGHICVITPKQLTPTRWQKSAVMRDLVTLADTILLNQTDLAREDEQAQALSILKQVYPPKHSIISTQFGELSDTETLKILDDKASPSPFTLLQGLQEHADLSCQLHQTHTSQLPHCRLVQSQTGAINTLGWVFDTQVQFNRNAFKTFITSLPHLVRAKGLLKTGKEWQLFNFAENSFSLSDIAWRQDSRLELIFDTEFDFEALETDLSKALLTSV